MKIAELMMAASQVIAIRVVMMFTAGVLPSAADRREFELMGSEKITAFGESWYAMNAQWVHSNTQFALSMMQEGWRFWLQLAWPALAVGTPIGVGAAATPLQLQHAGLDIIEKGVTPIHRTVVANAERLASAAR